MYILYVFICLFILCIVSVWSHTQHSMEIRGQPVEILGIEFRLLSLATETVINWAISPAFIHLYPLYKVHGFIKTFFNKYFNTVLHLYLLLPVLFVSLDSFLLLLCHHVIYTYMTQYIHVCVCNLEPTNERKCVCFTESNLIYLTWCLVVSIYLKTTYPFM